MNIGSILYQLLYEYMSKKIIFIILFSSLFIVGTVCGLGGCTGGGNEEVSTGPVVFNTPEAAVTALNHALDQNDTEALLNLLTSETRSDTERALQAMAKNGTLPQFFGELRTIKETHRTEDYVEFQLVRLEEGGPTTYSIYLRNVPNTGWQFDGL